MKYTGRQSFCDEVKEDYDIDHVISKFVDRTKELIHDVGDDTFNAIEEKQVLKAIIQTLLDSI